MATTAPASQQQRVKTYGGRSRPAKVSETDDIYAMPRSPSPNAKSRMKSTSTKYPQSRHDSKSVVKSKNAPSRPKRDVYDLSQSDDDATRTTYNTARATKSSLSKPGRTRLSPVKGDALRSPKMAAKPALASKLAAVSEKLRANGGQSSKNPSDTRNDDFDFPRSSDEEPQNAGITVSSKVQFGKKKAGVTNKLQSIKSRPAPPSTRTLAPSPISKSAHREIVEARKAKAISKEETHAEPINVSLPVRHMKTKNDRSQDGKAARSRHQKPRSLQPQRRALVVNEPARSVLATMLEEDSPIELQDSTSPKHRNFDVMSLDSPTAASTHSGSPEHQPRETVQTPKQRALWGRLLDSLDDIDSPSDLPVADLSMTTSRKRAEPMNDSVDLAEIIRLPQKKIKLVSVLKHSTTEPTVQHEELPSDSDSDTSSSSEVDEVAVVIAESQIPQRRQQATSGKATYSQQRTYLAEQNEDSMLDAMIEEMSQPMTRSLEVSQKDDFDLASDDDDDADEAGQPKSAHDLRAAGSKKRMLQDLESLISGLENERLGISSRRADFIDVTNALLAPGTAELILDHGMDRSIVAAFTNAQDAVLAVLGCFCLSLLANATQQLMVLRGFIRAGVLERLFKLLENDSNMDNVIKDRKTNMSGIAQRKLTALNKEMILSCLWLGYPPGQMSPQLAALRLLELIVHRFNTLGAEEAVLDEDQLQTIVTILHKHQSTANGDIYDWLVFSILKSTSTGAYVSKRGPWTARNIEIAFLSVPAVLKSDAMARTARRLALAFIINLTNDNKDACETITRQSVSASIMQLVLAGMDAKNDDKDTDEDADEELILCLGVLINMAELSDFARLQVLSEAPILLQSLLRLFCQYADDVGSVETSESDTYRKLPFGYLALWIVNLCQNPATRAEILRGLSSKMHVEMLIQIAESFAMVNSQTDLGIQTGAARQPESSSHGVNADRLLKTIDELKRASSSA